MKRKLLSLLMLLMAVSGAWADGSGNCGTTGHESEVTWSFVSSTGVLTISGTGAMEDYLSYTDTPWYSNINNITSIVVGSGVTTIGKDAFKSISNLTSITIPASVKTIGENAFQWSGLTSVTFETGSQLTTIGKSAFYKTGLTSVTIPASVKTIGHYAFYACSNLASVIVNRMTPEDPAPTLGEHVFQSNAVVRKIYIPSSSWSPFTSVWYGYSNDLVGIPEYFEATNITANKDVNSDADYWCTYYNSTYSMQVSSGVTIYKAKVNDDKTKVILTEVGGNTITVGQAVVLKSSSASISLSQKLEAAGDYSGNELKGTSTDEPNFGGTYCLSNETTRDDELTPRGVGFYLYSATSIPAHRAYLVVTGGPTNSRGFLGFGDDDDATAIDNGKWKIDNSDGTIYDLSGRIVTGQPRKGIYVKNGKLVVIK